MNEYELSKKATEQTKMKSHYPGVNMAGAIVSGAIASSCILVAYNIIGEFGLPKFGTELIFIALGSGLAGLLYKEKKSTYINTYEEELAKLVRAEKEKIAEEEQKKKYSEMFSKSK